MFVASRTSRNVKSVAKMSRTLTKVTKPLVSAGLNHFSAASGSGFHKTQGYFYVQKCFYTNKPLKYNHFEFQTCVELQQKACEMFGDKPVLGTKVGNAYEWMSYKQLGEDVQSFRNVLASKNLKFDDKVALISNNRAEWVVAMYATMSLGGQLVPMWVFSFIAIFSYFICWCNSFFYITGTRLSLKRIGNISSRIPTPRFWLLPPKPSTKKSKIILERWEETSSLMLVFRPCKESLGTLV